MNNDIKKQLELETTEELCNYFKAEEAIDFKKKLLAGIILHERQYDKGLLIDEKAKLKASIEQQIKEFEDKPTLRKKILKGHKVNIIYSLMSIVVLVALLALIYLNVTRDNSTQKFVLIAALVIYPLLFAYRIFTFRKGIKASLDEEKKNYELQKQKLVDIERYWKFD